MKRHYWQYLIDSAGNAVSGARIHVFLANSSNYANIYLTEEGSPVTSELTEILTDTDGFFDFWLSDLISSPEYGYSSSQRFKLTWSKPGLVTGGLNNVDIIWGGSGGDKVKINEDDTTADYLENKLLAGNNIAISPSGEQLVIAFEGIADTYKVKLNEDDTEDYLENKVIAGNNITITPSGTQLIISGDEVEPGSNEITFTSESLTVSPSVTGTFTLSDFLNRGICNFLKVEETTGLYYDVYLCRDSDFSSEFSKINYAAQNINSVSSFEDYEPFWVRDDELSSQLYIKIINKSATYTGYFTVTLTCEKFA
jgi:hypothetical protein